MQSKTRSRASRIDLSGGALVCFAALVLCSTPASARDLSFEDRVQAQAAIERVYYSHQIGARKTFEAAVPRPVLEQRVRTYLEQSDALEKFWNTPVTEDMLSSELQRMARQTRMPERLQELYSALGNDVFLIEECLARPALVGRMSRNFFAFDKTIHAESRAQAQELHDRLKAGRIDPRASHPNRNEIAVERLANRDKKEGQSSAEPSPGPDPSFLPLPSEEFDRFAGLAPETPGEIGPLVEEREMFVVRTLLESSADEMKIASFVVRKKSWDEWWSEAGRRLDAGRVRAASSGRNPLPTPGLRQGRASGGATSDSGAGAAVQTLSSAQLDSVAASGGQLSLELVPADDVWNNGSLYNVPDPRYSHTAIWTGSEMIVWGGFNGGAYLNTGARYNPSTDTWVPTSLTNAPAGRAVHTAVWTGSEMIIWGGYSPTIIKIGPLTCDSGTLVNRQFNPTNTGGRYDPVADSWRPTLLAPTNGDPAPAPRYGHGAVYSVASNVMIVWGGFGLSRTDVNNVPVLDYLNTGGYYDLFAEQWTATPLPAYDPNDQTTLNPAVPTGRWLPSLALIQDDPSFTDPNTGDFHAAQVRVAIWGGYGATAYADGKQNDCNKPPKEVHFRTVVSCSTSLPPCGNDYLNTGWIYVQSNDNGLNTWGNPTTTANAPDPRQYQTTVWTGSKMVIWGGYRNGSSVSTGGLYDPASDSWSATNSTGAPTGRYFHTAVWADGLARMLVWGGFDGQALAALDTGALYDPVGNSWSAITTTNAPDPRYQHSAVWTGGQMIVWGGLENGQTLGTGGRYTPGPSESWAPTARATTPAGRSEHAAVWTGSLMVTFGGIDKTSGVYFGAGDRYNPATDSWTPASTTGAPEARSSPTAIWTGGKMIVWGGYKPQSDPTNLSPVQAVNTGGLYDPNAGNAGSWSSTTTTGAPVGRRFHTAIWTGGKMVVWGGAVPTFVPQVGAVLNVARSDGGAFDPSAGTWTALSTTGAPAIRYSHSAVWTGSQMVVWGGYDGTNFLNTGGRYDPAGDAWTPTSATGAPTIRREHAAVWTGAPQNLMLVWGGLGILKNSQGDPFQANLDTGGRYDPAADSWTPTGGSGATAPEGRFGPSAIWTGTQMIVWGGSKGSFGAYPSTGGRYDPASDLWSSTSLTDVPSGRYKHTAVWTGSTMLVWGGYDGAPLGSGGQYSALSGIAATYYRDADGDGCGDPATAVQSSSQPVGYVTNSLDCNDSNGTVWSAPSEVPSLGLTDGTTLAWSRPLNAGAASLLYDALRSGSASDFVNGATCLATGTVSLSASDGAVPAPGQAFFYLIRAKDGCPDGQGPLGTDSSGATRVGRSCP